MRGGPKKCYAKIVAINKIENACRWKLMLTGNICIDKNRKSLSKQVETRYHIGAGMTGKLVCMRQVCMDKTGCSYNPGFIAIRFCECPYSRLPA